MRSVARAYLKECVPGTQARGERVSVAARGTFMAKWWSHEVSCALNGHYVTKHMKGVEYTLVASRQLSGMLVLLYVAKVGEGGMGAGATRVGGIKPQQAGVTLGGGGGRRRGDQHMGVTREGDSCR